MRTLRAGTRGSALARWQTQTVLERLAEDDPDLRTETQVVTTRGDVDLSDHLAGRLDKGFFTAELEAGLRDGSLDLAVHSLKDLPTTSPEGLHIGAVLPRGPAADWLIVRPDAVVHEATGRLPLIAGARVGSSALRREALLRRYAPRAQALPLRGNVPTRVERLREGRYDAIVIAAAGVSRLALDLGGLAVFELDATRWIPAPGQGAIAVQCRADDAALTAQLARIGDADTARAVGLERALLRASEGGCASAFGAYMAATDRLVWGLERDGVWARQLALLSATADDGDAFAAFHHPGPPWEDDDHAPLYHAL